MVSHTSTQHHQKQTSTPAHHIKELYGPSHLRNIAVLQDPYTQPPPFIHSTAKRFRAFILNKTGGWEVTPSVWHEERPGCLHIRVHAFSERRKYFHRALIPPSFVLLSLLDYISITWFKDSNDNCCDDDDVVGVVWNDVKLYSFWGMDGSKCDFGERLPSDQGKFCTGILCYLWTWPIFSGKQKALSPGTCQVMHHKFHLPDIYLSTCQLIFVSLIFQSRV